MAVVPPSGFLFYTQGTLEGILLKNTDLREALRGYFQGSFFAYLTLLESLNSFNEFEQASVEFSFAVKYGYARFVNQLGNAHLQNLLDRTVVCSFISADQMFISHVDVVPETVKADYYYHVPFTKNLH